MNRAKAHRLDGGLALPMPPASDKRKPTESDCAHAPAWNRKRAERAARRDRPSRLRPWETMRVLTAARSRTANVASRYSAATDTVEPVTLSPRAPPSIRAAAGIAGGRAHMEEMMSMMRKALRTGPRAAAREKTMSRSEPSRPKMRTTRKARSDRSTCRYAARKAHIILGQT